MSTLEKTISILEVLSEADLIKIQDFAKRLFQQQRNNCPFPLKSREDIYRELEVSRQQATSGDYQEAGEFLTELRKEYGI